MDQSVAGSDQNLPSQLAEAFDTMPVRNDWAEQTMRQIEKDFSLQGISLSLPAKSPGLHELVSMISAEMNAAKLLDKTQLLGLLYQLDINESLIRSKIAKPDIEDPYSLFAMEIIKRCFTKVYWRNTLK